MDMKKSYQFDHIDVNDRSTTAKSSYCCDHIDMIWICPSPCWPPPNLSFQTEVKVMDSINIYITMWSYQYDHINATSMWSYRYVIILMLYDQALVDSRPTSSRSIRYRTRLKGRPRLHECRRLPQAEVISDRKSKVHQTWDPPFCRSLYTLARLRGCCRQAQTAVASSSRNKIHEAWPEPFSRALYIWVLGNGNVLDGLYRPVV